MSSDRTAELSRVLADARRRTEHAIADFERDIEGVVAASESSNADDEHDPEGATIAFERAQILALLDQARLRLADIDGALARVAAGTYGTCTRCGRPIDAERLTARPSASTCIRCAR